MLRKIFIAIFFIFATSCFAEELTGFLGIPFGTEKRESWNQMRAKGWNCCDEYELKDKKTSVLAFNERQYAGKNVEFIQFWYINNYFDSVEIYFEDNEDVLPVLNAIVKKYNLVPFLFKNWFTTKDKKIKVYFDDKSNVIEITRNNTSSIESDI